MVKQYSIDKSLASGSTGKVRKATHLNKSYAIKMIDCHKKPDQEVIKEIKIHSLLDHPNIVKLIDHYKQDNTYCLVMQLAETELFDLIEPGEGLSPVLVHFYFRQLLSAVSYLHEKGIVHRDIKPENILLDEKGNLLLSDFGNSTIFKHKGRKRILSTLVGSYRYMAPEIISGRYSEDVDLWSMGMLLLILFTGTTPWERPVSEDDGFLRYMQMRNHNYAPFNKLSTNILKLFKRLCAINPENRMTLRELRDDLWLKEPSCIEDELGMCKDHYQLMSHISPKLVSRMSFSQPEKLINRFGGGNIISSQPYFNTFDLPLLKRIYSSSSKHVLIHVIGSVLEEMVVPYVAEDSCIAFTTVDSSRNEMQGEIVIEMLNSVSCISFTRIKGDCIEFKRFFNIFKERIQSIDR